MQSHRRSERTAWRAVFAAVLVLFVGAGAVLYLIAIDEPKAAFPQTVSIPAGSSVRVATNALARQNIVRSPRLLELYISILGDGRVVSGDYLFETPAPLYVIADRVTSGDYGAAQIRVTIPEGSTLRDMARIFATALPNFDQEAFITLTKGKEGYLFPDTYFVFPSMTEQDIVQKMERTFNTRIAELAPQLAASKHSLQDIITMASLIEREAGPDATEQRMIAGILWKRIAQGMLLQVDAPFWFLMGKGTKDLTTADLRIDSRYNTYRYKGLPPTPIGSPGMAAIRAALEPIDSAYVFYLHDADGIVHYAVTHNEHVNNKNKYLK